MRKITILTIIWLVISLTVFGAVATDKLVNFNQQKAIRLKVGKGNFYDNNIAYKMLSGITPD